MATFLDIGLLQKFDIIFPFLLIFVLIYAILIKTMLKDKEAFAFLIAFALSIMTLFSPIAVKTINLMAPWFVLLFIFVIFILLAYQAMGVPESSIIKIVSDSEYSSDFFYWMLALVLIIGIGSLTAVISSEAGFGGLGGGEVPTTGETSGFFSVIFNSKVLGMGVILLIAVMTISRLASKSKA